MLKPIALPAAALPLAAALLLASPAAQAQKVPDVPKDVERPFHKCVDSLIRRRSGGFQRIRDVARTTKDLKWGERLTIKVRTAIFTGCKCMIVGTRDSAGLTPADKKVLLHGTPQENQAYKPSDKSKAAFQALRKQCLTPMVKVDRETHAAIEEKIKMGR